MYGFNAKTGKFVIGGRASFPELAAPKPIGKNPKPDAKEKYQLTVVINEEQQKEQWFTALKAQIALAENGKFGEPGSPNRPRKIKSPLLTLDDIKNKVPEGYEESDVFIRLNSEMKPQVVIKDADGVKAVPDDDIKRTIYPGCQVAVSCDIYAWVHTEGGPGVSMGLGNVMKTGDGEPWGAGSTSAADDFGVDVSASAAEDDFLG